jgi:hypothetical protein
MSSENKAIESKGKKRPLASLSGVPQDVESDLQEPRSKKQK